MASQLLADLKTCPQCGMAKPATTEWFHKKLSKLTARCKPCVSTVKKTAWRANAEKVNAARRAARNDDTRRHARERYAADPARKRASVYAWRSANPDKKKQIDKEHYKKYRDKKKRQALDWAKNNRAKKNEYTRIWLADKRSKDPVYRLRSSVSAYVYWCLKQNKDGKKTEDILGFSITDLRRHLQRQFQPGMTWENYGQWHVDHILPIASFSFTSPDDDDFKACWAITNLRPLWAKDNIRKSDKRELLI